MAKDWFTSRISTSHYDTMHAVTTVTPRHIVVCRDNVRYNLLDAAEFYSMMASTSNNHVTGL